MISQALVWILIIYPGMPSQLPVGTFASKDACTTAASEIVHVGRWKRASFEEASLCIPVERPLR
jgi:hypothetical protein